MSDLLSEFNGGVTTITLNRPRQHNAITQAMWLAIPELCREIAAREDVRVVVWRGAGEGAFSAGGDIGEFAQQRSNRRQARIYNEAVGAALEAILALPKPNLALIKGFCVGGGLILAAHCDVRIAAGNARFGIPIAKLGALISYEQMQRFVHLIGPAAIADLLLTARLIDAQEARTMGLCTQVFALDEIDEQVARQAAEMVDFAPLVQKWHKQMVQSVLHKPELADLTDPERSVLDDCFDSEDYAEGTAAFLEKRKPRFKGR